MHCLLAFPFFMKSSPGERFLPSGDAFICVPLIFGTLIIVYVKFKRETKFRDPTESVIPQQLTTAF